jgi:hypothetical protein
MRHTVTPAVLTHRHEYTPPWLEGQKPKPVYWMRSASFADRTQYEAELDTAAGPEVMQWQKDMAFAQGLAETFLPDREDQPENGAQRDRITELLSQIRSGEEVSEEDKAFVNSAWLEVSQTWLPLKELTFREAHRRRLMPGFALRHFCIGLDNVKDARGAPVAFEADGQERMAEHVLMRIDKDDLLFAGQFADDLQYGRSAEKNSSPPSKSGSRRKSSTEAGKALG